MRTSAQRMSTITSKNEPESLEVAAIIVGVEYRKVITRYILLRERGTINQNESEMLERISIRLCYYDPLSFVRLFLDGSNGWHQGTPFFDIIRCFHLHHIHYQW